MNDIIWLTIRRLRVPLIVLIIVFFLSVIGLVLIPGMDQNGQPVRLSYLDAAYFLAIVATTIGLGEIPYAFTNAQRLYVFLIIFPNVAVWLYSFGTILGLLLDPQFRNVLWRARFERRVSKLPHRFFIICGFGNTGSMIVNALLHRGYQTVVLEREDHIIRGMILQDHLAHVPALSGDVTDRRLLEMAGLMNPRCAGVIAITHEDHANLTVAITSKLLRPDLPVLARSETPMTSANMASFGTDHIVDPYDIFSSRFMLALNSPTKFLVQDWLISVPGSQLRKPLSLPSGQWILCGLGRFGSRIAARLEEAALPFTVVEVHPDRLTGRHNEVLGRGTEAGTLLQADVKNAVGIIAGTSDDVDNLSILMTAHELNPALFLVARQERQENDVLFAASHAHLVAKRSLIVARRILSICTTPLLQIFLHHMVQEDEDFAQHVAARLRSTLKGYAPSIWTQQLSGPAAQGLANARNIGLKVRLEHINIDSRASDAPNLSCVCLLLQRGAGRIFLPEASQELHEGDQLLFAGRESARIEITWTLTEPAVVMGNVTGKPVARGALFRWLERRRWTQVR
jgi:Trk K+ transport system NAD-binding subunit